MDDQRFIYDSASASAAAGRAAEHARACDAVTVIDVAEDRTRREAVETYDRRDIVDGYRELLLDGPQTMDSALAELADTDPADGIFVGPVDGERTVVSGDAALAALSDLEPTD